MSILVQRLTVMYGLPNDTPDPQAFLAEISRLVRGYAEPEQQKAADMLIRENDWWPKPNAICVACADAREYLHVSDPKTPDKRQDQTWTADALKRADVLLQTQMGQEAADEGWVLSLWDFCRKHSRLPKGAEVADVKRHAREFDEAYAKATAGGWGAAKSMRELGDTMLARRKQKAAWAYGEIIDRKPDRKTLATGDAS